MRTGILIPDSVPLTLVDVLDAVQLLARRSGKTIPAMFDGVSVEVHPNADLRAVAQLFRNRQAKALRGRRG